MKKGLAEGLSYTGLQMQDIRRRLLFTEESRDTLRARVAELEAALREILPVDDDPVWGLRDDHPIHRELGTLRAARAALGAGKETP